MIPPRPPPEKRYGWWRKYKGFLGPPEMAVVALHAEVPALVAGAIADKLCECASKSVPQGRLDDWSAEECAASLKVWQLDMDARDVDRVYGALEGMGWIEQGYIPSWDDRGGRGSFE